MRSSRLAVPIEIGPGDLLEHGCAQQQLVEAGEQTGEPSKARLPEEIVTISGRWVSIKEFGSGDIAVKVIRYDPDVVSLVKSIAKANFARYSPKWKSWNVPRWRANIVQILLRLRSKSKTVSIVLNDRE